MRAFVSCDCVKHGNVCVSMCICVYTCGDSDGHVNLSSISHPLQLSVPNDRIEILKICINIFKLLPLYEQNIPAGIPIVRIISIMHAYQYHTIAQL